MPQLDEKSGKELESILNKVSEAWNLTEFQRDQSNESIRFVDVAGAQWEGWAGHQFADRVRMVVDRVGQAVNKFNTEWRKGRFGVKYRPDDEKTSEDDAELLNGLFRKDWRKSNGDQSMDNAVGEMSKGGVGAIKLSTEFEIADDPDAKSQKIVFKPVHNAYNSVVWDPNAKEQDKSDAGWCDLITTFTEDAFKEAYPHLDPISFFQPENRSIFDFTSMRLVYVAEHYRVVEKNEMAFSYHHELTGEKRIVYKSDLDEHLIGELTDMGFNKVNERRIKRRTIEKGIIYGGGFISPFKKIVGDRIPVAPVYGYRSYVDGQEWYYGLVEKLKDAQRLVNMAISSMAENSATSPKQMPILTPEQVAGHETRWAQQHLGKHSYTLLNSVDDEGAPIPLGPIQFTQPAAVDPNANNLFEVATGHIQQAGGGAPQDTIDPDASGKAINAMIEQVDLQTGLLNDNISQCLKTVGEIYKGMASEVYDEERFIKISREDGSDKDVLLLEYVMHPKLDQFIRINDVRNMKMECVVDTGPTFANQRRETVDTLSQLIQVTPPDSPYMPVMFAGIIENVEGTSLDMLKEFNRKQMILNGFTKPETPEEELMLREANKPQEPAADVILAQAEDKKAQADIAEVERKTQVDQFTQQISQLKQQIDGFDAETRRLKVQIDGQKASADIQNKEVDTFDKKIDMRQKQIDDARQLVLG